jgi:hypothetical protein
VYWQTSEKLDILQYTANLFISFLLMSTHKHISLNKTFLVTKSKHLSRVCISEETWYAANFRLLDHLLAYHKNISRTYNGYLENFTNSIISNRE